MGSSVLQRRPKNRCAGLVPMPSVGVFLQLSSAKNSDSPDARHFVKSLFTVFTAFSAFPFDCGYRGDDVM